MTTRIVAELELLRTRFPDILYQANGHWFLIPAYPMPAGRVWTPSPMPVAFHAQPGHPGQHPYGIYVPSGVRVDGHPPANFKDTADKRPPFPGSWAVLSWQPDGGQWIAKDDIRKGSNLLNYALGFTERFLQGK
jgi:hypothetical protein